MDKISYGEEDGYDAIVVGSGYGGSIAACRLSMAGIKVCLIEKGKKWEAQDFPTDSMKLISTVRMENQNVGISYGPKDALFQVYEHDDSLAAVACGLGGGSLVNAGVMLSTPVLAKRNPNWPKEWENDWDDCEASASAMLGRQSIPVKFPAAKVMEKVTDEEIGINLETSLKLSINFDVEEQQSKTMALGQMNNCLACGNCLAGCPYNAKSSTDKNYLLLAIRAGCEIKTECQVQFVVLNPLQLRGEGITLSKRRWRVYFNEIAYIGCDYVILSAGVFGTTEILFRSQMRGGLKISEALGSGFSCNGNTVAYVAGSPAPLRAYGLNRKQLSKVPFHERPGPSITSSYKSSLGFTIQSAVLPMAYPHLLFKGITTYGWPAGCSFLRGIIDKIKCITGLKASQAIVLNAMGYDDSNGRITLQKNTDKICFFPPHDPLLPRKIETFQKISKKLGGILFMSRYRSTSVHLLGGCNVSSNPSRGVCNSSGQVYDPNTPSSVHHGLYVCDASLIPCSVGINPCLIIATAAEHVCKRLISDILEYKKKIDIGVISVKNVNKHSEFEHNKQLKSSNRSWVRIKETMRGYVGGMPCSAHIIMKMHYMDQKDFSESEKEFGAFHPLLRGKVGGYVRFRAIEKENLHVLDGEVNLCDIDSRTPYTQYMSYRLLLGASSGSRYLLKGKKILNPYLFGLYAWGESTKLHVTFEKVAENSSKDKMINLRGELKISSLDLLKSLISLEGSMRIRFLCVLSQTLLRTYILQIPRRNYDDFITPEISKITYPSSILHEIKAEDGFIISCRQWKCSQNSLGDLRDKRLDPVLLLNGYSTESYCLPTEQNDLVRTLLKEGHETWILQPRLHFHNPSNNFTIEDVGRFDIPAAINKILELHEPGKKVHIVAHCVGGLAVHMALLGGHVSHTNVASLSCTSTAMFFEINALNMVKMWLPLLPISMALLGNNKILTFIKGSKDSLRHQLAKFIAKRVPRYERCTCNECEIFSGIFGNIFWHQNVSPSLHEWLNKESFTSLPMAAFPHLQKMCKAGYIVDSKGNNIYLNHPERMALPTLYISGGRSILVTPRTSFLANKYMKLHQPEFRHERVVVDGLGHSDLLIGEESDKKVFPHILSHMRLAEEERNGSVIRKYSSEVLDWSDDPFEQNEGFTSWFSPSLVCWLFFFLLYFSFRTIFDAFL